MDLGLSFSFGCAETHQLDLSVMVKQEDTKEEEYDHMISCPDEEEKPFAEFHGKSETDVTESPRSPYNELLQTTVKTEEEEEETEEEEEQHDQPDLFETGSFEFELQPITDAAAGSGSGSSQQFRASHWRVGEIRELLAITAERATEFTGTVKDGILHKKVAEELCRRGHRRNKKQVTSKLKNLRRKYHQVRDHNNGSGGGGVWVTIDWEHFEACRAIWGTANKTAKKRQNVRRSLGVTLVGSPASNTPENANTVAEEKRDAAGSQGDEVPPENLPESGEIPPENLPESDEITPENLPESLESQTGHCYYSSSEQAPPLKKKKTATKAQAAAEEIKDFLVSMDRKDEQKEKMWREREEERQRSEREEDEKRWEEEKTMREAERSMRAEQMRSLADQFRDMHQGMQNEFALLRKTMAQLAKPAAAAPPPAPQYSTPRHHRPPVPDRYSGYPSPLLPSFNSEDSHSSSSDLQQLD
ncbi:golgin subfamily A member 6B-like isoform X1 [Sardina pilchardus]|uniref:golgin subfamily A member 6B-like isoform X1 n=1 Tax=Sardina pilchardus TaxID=27697 RepID=UPI002E0D32F5